MVQGEGGHAASDSQDDEVFGEWVSFPKQGDMESHDGEQLTGFGEDKGEVVDVGKRGITEWGRHGGGECNEEERGQSRGGGEDLKRAGLVDEVGTASGEGKERLDGIEEDGETKVFHRRLRRVVECVGRGGNALLQKSPCQEGRINSSDADNEGD